MAETSNVELRPLTEQEKNTVPEPVNPIPDVRAATIARETFEQMENARRTAGHDRRYSTGDELYCGYQSQRFWEGTRIPRSSIGVPLAMDQVEALMPQIMGACFPLRDNIQMENQPGTQPEEAMAAWFLLMQQLDNIGGKSSLGVPISFREVFRRIQKSKLIYGNGVAELTWESYTVKRKKLTPTKEPIVRKAFDSVTGVNVPVVVGEKDTFREEIVEEKVNKPRLRVLDIRDFYVDPNCQSPNIQDARFCAVRELTTVDDLKRRRGLQGFNIPPDDVLVQMAKEKAGSYTDWSKTSIDTYRSISSQPQNDWTADPGSGRIEVVRVYIGGRITWLFNRHWLGYNGNNTFGFLPFFDDFYVDVPNRFHSMSVPDVIEGEQRLQQGIINSRIDELALSIHSPFIKKRGAFQRSLRMYPGAVFEVENPKEDLIRMEMGNITAQAFVEVDASDRRAQKRTGASDLAILGTSSAGGNSANRTAAGVNVQASASSGRIVYQVANSGDNFIIPLMHALHKLNQMYLRPEQVIQVLGPMGQYIQLNAYNIINADVKFVFKASERMKQRMMTLQVMPLILQTYMNPVMLEHMAKMGKTLDVARLDMKLSDAIGWTPGTLWRDLNPQEMAAFQQPSPDKMLQMQMQDKRMAQMDEMADKKQDTELMKTISGKLLTPDAAHSVLDLPLPMEVKAKTNGQSKNKK